MLENTTNTSEQIIILAPGAITLNILNLKILLRVPRDWCLLAHNSYKASLV